MFKLTLRLSDQKAARWDEKYVDEEFAKISSTKSAETAIKKVWVCGPPLLEEKFDHFMEKICKKYEMDFTT